MPRRNVISRSAMILGYVQLENFNEALQLFEQMELEGSKPNKVTFVGVLKACISLDNSKIGRKIHSSILEN